MLLVTRFSLIWVGTLASVLLMLVGRGAVGPEGVAMFLERHCFECHGDGVAKGGLALDALPMVISGEAEDSAQVEWQGVLEKLEMRSMPPRKVGKARPEEEAVTAVIAWIRGEFAGQGITPEVDHKRAMPSFGNQLDHVVLFDGSHKGPAFSEARLWRKGPQVYDRFVDALGGRGLREATAIHQPFAIDESKGVIADYASAHFADDSTLQLLLMNCQSIAEYQTTGILKREHDGSLHRHHRRAEAFLPIVEGTPMTEDWERAIRFEYRLLLEREPTGRELAETLAFCEAAVAKGGTVRGLQATLVSIMLKPEAVYRLEIGLGPEDAGGRRRLSWAELAFALVFALVDEGPTKVRVTEEETLWDLAEAGKLETPEQIQEAVKLVLDRNDMSTADYTMFAEDHRVRNTRVLRFFRDFFGYHHATRVFKDEKRIGIDSGFDTEEMVEDADQLVMHVFDEDRDVLRRLMTTNRYFVAYPGSYEKFEKDLNYIRYNYDDAGYQFNIRYIERTLGAGRTPIPIEGPSSRTYVGFYNLDHDTWDFPTNQPFPLPKEERAGLLMHPAWLIAWSGNFDNDPIRRGKWILEHLLAGSVPDIPLTVNAVVPEDHDKTLRERLSATEAKACWQCHQKMNPLGLPFENFDDFGRFRKTETLGETLSIFPERHREAKRVPVDTRGAIIDSGDPALDGEVRDAFELVHQLADSTRVRQSFVRHAFRFWMGRNETLDDSPTLMAAERAYVENGGSMKALIASLLSSDSFLYRK
ncbi:MAG: hypothetical protein ACI957_002863 [Verrucomicrobiales bacterium]|jgi:hypothetical protein